MRASIPVHNLCQTFRDAITVSRRFGLQYLLPVWAINHDKFDAANLPAKKWGGLLLTRHSKGIYTRVGRLDMYSDRDDIAEWKGRTRLHLAISSIKALFDASVFVQDPGVNNSDLYNEQENTTRMVSGERQRIITLI